jgi:hypothetical protein
MQPYNGSEYLWSCSGLWKTPAGDAVRSPRSSYRRPMLREDGGPNRDFLTYLFCFRGIAMQFLMAVRLLRSKVQCSTCDGDMTWSVEPSIPEVFRWRCRKGNDSRSIKYGSWFQLWSTPYIRISYFRYRILSIFRLEKFWAIICFIAWHY